MDIGVIHWDEQKKLVIDDFSCRHVELEVLVGQPSKDFHYTCLDRCVAVVAAVI